MSTYCSSLWSPFSVFVLEFFLLTRYLRVAFAFSHTHEVRDTVVVTAFEVPSDVVESLRVGHLNVEGGWKFHCESKAPPEGIREIL